jgi:uncharacterized lipoprotein YddW (UPF0748 family)
MTRRKAVSNHVLLRMAVLFSQLADAASQAKEKLLLVHAWWREARFQFSGNAMELSRQHAAIMT